MAEASNPGSYEYLFNSENRQATGFLIILNFYHFRNTFARLFQSYRETYESQGELLQAFIKHFPETEIWAGNP